MVQQLHILKCTHASGIEINQIRQAGSHLANINVYDPPRIRHFAKTPKGQSHCTSVFGITHQRYCLPNGTTQYCKETEQMEGGISVSRSSSYKVIFFFTYAIQQVLINYLFYAQWCMYVNPSLPIYPPFPSLVIHHLVSTQL